MPRLSKVTKELNVGLQTCVDFLQKKGYTVENSLNAKINDEQYELLVLQFSQDKDVRLKAEQAQRERMASKMEAKATAVVEEPKKEEPKKEEKPSVSFKVLGKIDLEPHKSAPKSEPKVEATPEPVVEEAPVVEAPAPVVVEEAPAPAPAVEEAPVVEEPQVTEPEVAEAPSAPENAEPEVFAVKRPELAA